MTASSNLRSIPVCTGEPKGTRAIFENESEAEVTLPPKRQFRVLERYRNVRVESRKVENYYVVELLEA